MNQKFQYLLLFLIPLFALSQTNTFSPYSRYALGDLNQPTFAHNAGMGGAYIALKPDSTMPIFINAGNPAAYALIKLTSLEVGGNYLYSQFKGANSSLNKWTANFSYGALGFPVRSRGGACFGLMPYTNVGYDLKASSADINSGGDINYLYNGTGGLNKVFAGYGIMPFADALKKFKKNRIYIPDSIRTLSKTQFKLRHFTNKLLSDFSIGFNVNYIFGNIENTSRVVYPNSTLYNNTYRARNLSMGDFTGNFGLQTAISIDSIKNNSKAGRRVLKEKVKITFGYFMSLNNQLKVNYDNTIYNYVLNGFGQEIIRDTVLYKVNQKSTISLPLEQGFGIGFKKGERISAVADFAITNWQNFKFLENASSFKNNYRVAAGINYVPQKYAAGSNAFIKRINYRFGLSYQTGYIELQNSTLANYAATIGFGLPVGIGRLSSMVNIALQVGQNATTNSNLIKENYFKVNFGFTFSDRWFQKFKYD